MKIIYGRDLSERSVTIRCNCGHAFPWRVTSVSGELISGARIACCPRCKRREPIKIMRTE